MSSWFEEHTGACSFSQALNDCSAIQPKSSDPGRNKDERNETRWEGRLGAVQYVQTRTRQGEDTALLDQILRRNVLAAQQIHEMIGVGNGTQQNRKMWIPLICSFSGLLKRAWRRRWLRGHPDK